MVGFLNTFLSVTVSVSVTLSVSAFLGSSKKAWVFWVSLAFFGLPPFEPLTLCFSM
jgi:hypothetical protein